MVYITVFEFSRSIHVWEDVSVYLCLVFQSKKVSLSRKVIVAKNGSLGVCDVSLCWRLFILYAAFYVLNICGLEDVSVFQGFSLKPTLEKHFGLSSDVRSQNSCSCLDVTCRLFPGNSWIPSLYFVKSRPSKIYFVYFYGYFVWLQEFPYEVSLHATFPIVKSFCMMAYLVFP